jgi:hypothetical protein
MCIELVHLVQDIQYLNVLYRFITYRHTHTHICVYTYNTHAHGVDDSASMLLRASRLD